MPLWGTGGRAWILLGGRKNSKPRVREMLAVGAADRAGELQASDAQPKRVSAGHPQRPAARPAERSEDGVHVADLSPRRHGDAALRGFVRQPLRLRRR